MGGAGERWAFTLELLGKGLGGAADGNHIFLSRSMARIQEDKDSILGEHVSRQDRQATRQADDEAYRQQGSQGKKESCGE